MKSNKNYIIRKVEAAPVVASIEEVKEEIAPIKEKISKKSKKKTLLEIMEEEEE